MSESEAPLDYLHAIAEHSAGFARAAEGNLDAAVEHCPGWKVSDLVSHLTEVHWFWATIVDELLAEPPDDSRRPLKAPREDLIDVFRRGAEHLVHVLGAADATAPVYTWAPAQKDVAFVIRHQVQEAVVHHYDAVLAAGGHFEIATPIALDSIDEFLTFSVSSETDPAEPALPPLDGRFVLCCSDADASFLLTDGSMPGTVTFARVATGNKGSGAGIEASAPSLLLWLYGRVDLDTSALAPGLLDRFRALCFTD